MFSQSQYSLSRRCGPPSPPSYLLLSKFQSCTIRKRTKIMMIKRIDSVPPVAYGRPVVYVANWWWQIFTSRITIWKARRTPSIANQEPLLCMPSGLKFSDVTPDMAGKWTKLRKTPCNWPQYFQGTYYSDSFSPIKSYTDNVYWQSFIREDYGFSLCW